VLQNDADKPTKAHHVEQRDKGKHVYLLHC